MAEEKPCKTDIAAVFKRLRNITSNKVCFDCGAKNPTWASVTYGVFICMDCSAVHRSLGVHLSFVRSTQLDTNWTWLQLRAMQVGGNSNAHLFFQQHGCGSHDAQQKYNSRAAQLYREKLHHSAAAAMRLHGTKIHIEIPHAEAPISPEKKEHDFFKDIDEAHLYHKDDINDTISNGSCLKNSEFSQESNNMDSRLGVSLDPIASDKLSEPKKASLGIRKPNAAKKGLGGKKGLGAQRVNANFDDIEKEAEQLDRLREQAETASAVEIPPEEQEKQMASVRLAYKDLSLEQKKTEEKLRQTNPKKAEQLERLGMGFGGRSTGPVAHSAASEMKLITQEAPAGSQKSKDKEGDSDDFFEYLGFTSGPPKYGDSPFLSRDSSYSRLNDITAKGSWINEKLEKRPSIDSTSSKGSSSGSRAKKSASTSNLGSSDEAQKKFGNAKGISSDQFFGLSSDNDFERKANLTRFEGSSSISSEDFFGGDSRRSPSASTYNTPNLYDIKEGVRDGVTKVAGRISSIANGVMSSLQDRYA
ncbi:ADP-ribosylation factor GTPase-activating protein 2 isoform X1 [Parasteatoda tepidariorum]|uniref:ADP-ribosylation factor GTPase-activating protein 2 n=1 Tax=Parasteatoda tepidariorum TaxID=114398 RepID=A0A2L2XYC4_PARTP|nr:ADP-ribosylation factor GTPase-activating protein 2 isoform X2 [Parasteatoda tepidariorum]